ncbi:MAG: iron-sulfur cluster biosynthesis family protein, partial [Pseudomonadota bacterium]
MNSSAIAITDNALTHIARQLELTQSKFLRLGLKESGCNGFMYTLDFLEAPEQDDLCFEFEADVKVCVAAVDQGMILGTEID